jgi:phosphatidylinositol-3-phosphatase
VRPAIRSVGRPHVSAALVAFLALVIVPLVSSCQSGGVAPSGSLTPASQTSSPQTTQPLQTLRLDHIFVILEENKSYSQIVGSPAAPFINGLIKRYALAANYYALFHPSLPNYIALTSGSNDGITDDRGAVGNEVAATNIADRIEAAGKTWKEYAESIPSSGYAKDSGEYAVRHDPFMYYKDIAGNAERARFHVVPFGQLAVDLGSAATTPDFAFITPNLLNDMHDGPISTGDQWLARVVPTILQSKPFTTTRSVLIVTWDEGTLFDNHIATIFAGSSVKPGYRSGTRYDHYALLHTIEAALELAPLTQNDANAPTMGELFN